MLLNCGVGEDSWESLDCKEIKPVNSLGKSVLNIHWKDWCWSWNSSISFGHLMQITDSLEKTLMLGSIEGDDRGWEGWMASPTQWTWIWANSMSWWLTGKPGVLHSMGSQRVRHNWVTELNWMLWSKSYHLTTWLQVTETEFDNWIIWKEIWGKDK